MRLAAPLTAVAMLICSPVASGAQTSPELLTPPRHTDPRDAPASPLDVRDVTFGQQGLSLRLRIRTQQAWTARKRSGARSVCVLIGHSSALANPRRLCVGRSLRTTVLPSALGLALGPVWWAVESRWDG